MGPGADGNGLGDDPVGFFGWPGFWQWLKGPKYSLLFFDSTPVMMATMGHSRPKKPQHAPSTPTMPATSATTPIQFLEPAAAGPGGG